MLELSVLVLVLFPSLLDNRMEQVSQLCLSVFQLHLSCLCSCLSVLTSPTSQSLTSSLCHAQEMSGGKREVSDVVVEDVDEEMDEEEDHEKKVSFLTASHCLCAGPVCM